MNYTKKIKIKKNKLKINSKTKSKKTKKRFFKKSDYISDDGMLTGVWGPSLWHYLHIISFNYPINPTKLQKNKYKQLLLNLQYTLPCKYCRINLINNFKKNPLNDYIFLNRNNFSRYVYNLHELINKKLLKKSGLTYCDVRDRYEHFRSRCNKKGKLFNYSKKNKIKEKGCTTPLYGKKSKCVINIVPHEKKCKTFNMDKTLY
tara:strand:- start:1937 stop:2545 length:609 start_codon:yes stop_codon:yes gene_type:complete